MKNNSKRHCLSTMIRQQNIRIIYLVTLILLVLFIVLPIVNVLGLTFFGVGFSENFKELNNDLLSLLFKSSLLALSVAFFSTISGVILGFILYKTNVKYRNFFKLLILIPLFISPYILAIAWKDLSFFVFNSIEYDIYKKYSYFAIILVHSTIYIPLSILIIGSSMTNISKQLEESALLMTDFPNVFFKILIPLIKPAILSSFVLIFIFSISEFSVPSYFGIRVYTTEIFTQFSAFYNHGLAVLQSVLLIVLCMILLLSEKKHISESTFLSVGTKGKEAKIYDSNRLNIIGFWIMITVVFIMICLPVIVLILHSFVDGLDEFVKAFNLLLPSFGNSILLALLGAVCTVVIGFVAAYYSVRYNQNTIDRILLFTFAIPSIILGIALIKFYNKPYLNFIYSGLGIIILGYIGKYSFISAKIIRNSLKQIPKSMEDAAKIQGVGYIKRILKIVIPLIFPAIYAAFIINFLFCLGDLGTTIMVYPPGTEIMPIKVFTIMANAPDSLTSSMALIVFIFTILLISILFYTFKKILTEYNVNY